MKGKYWSFKKIFYLLKWKFEIFFFLTNKHVILKHSDFFFLLSNDFFILLYIWWAFNHQNWEEGKKKSVNMAKFSISDFHYGYQKDRNMII